MSSHRASRRRQPYGSCWNPSLSAIAEIKCRRQTCPDNNGPRLHAWTGTGELGGDILKSSSSHPQDYDNEIGQGISNDILFGSLSISWMLKHNLFIDANVIIRKSESPLPLYNNNTTITSLALRWNIPKRLYEF
jgi:hypothetical protein